MAWLNALRLAAEGHGIHAFIVTVVVLVGGLIGARASQDTVSSLVFALAAGGGAIALVVLGVITGLERAGWIPPVERPDSDFVNEPHLHWQDPEARQFGRAGYELDVVCTITGANAQVVPDSWVKSSQIEDRIDFHGFNKSGLIMLDPGRFHLIMRCAGDPLPADRTVTWRVTYMNTQMTRGYISECSVEVATYLRPRVGLNPKLDLTGPRERNTHFNRYYQGKTRSWSTGARRSD